MTHLLTPEKVIERNADVHKFYLFIIIMLKSREKGINEIQRTENDHRKMWASRTGLGSFKGL